MEFLSDGVWWVMTALSLVFTAIYVKTTMTTARDLLIVLTATGFVVVSFIFTGWIGRLIGSISGGLIWQDLEDSCTPWPN